MKKSLLALAVLGAFSSVASAQSSVTMYGRVDLSVGKNFGSANKVMQNGSGSRLGMRGVEDLGGGMQALFNIETRFDADTGAAQNLVVVNSGTGVANAGAAQNRFWSARSLVGLKGGFGQVVMGREYTTAFLGSQLANDPWGWDTAVASLNHGTVGITGLGIAAVRNDSSLTYNFAASGFSFGAQIAEATDTINSFQKKPVNFSLGYSGGPVRLNFGYEKTGSVGTGASGAAAKIATLGGSFDLGAVRLGASYAKGNTSQSVDRKSYMLTAVAPMGQGELRLALGQRENTTFANVVTKDIKLVAIGYHYALSKRTTVYADFGRNSGTNAATGERTAYDFGLKHNF